MCTWWVVKKKHIDRQILGRSIRIVRERWRWSRSCLRARQGKSAMTCRFEVDSLAPSPCGGSWWQLLFGGIDQCKLSLGIRLHRTCPWIWSSNNNVWAAGSRFLNSPYQTGSTTPPALFFPKIVSMHLLVAYSVQHLTMRGTICEECEYSTLPVMSELSTVRCDRELGLWIAGTRASSVDGELPWRCCGRWTVRWTAVKGCDIPEF